jgi:DNA-binding MarR family transcriptional regulator
VEHKCTKYCGCLYYTANALGRAMTRMADEEFATTGLASSYAFLLMTVGHHPGIQPTGISETMLLTPSTITRLIEKMESKGLVRRKSAGRATKVYLTVNGEQLLPKILDAWRNLYRRYSNLLGEDAAKQLTELSFEAVIKMEGIDARHEPREPGTSP